MAVETLSGVLKDLIKTTQENKETITIDGVVSVIEKENKICFTINIRNK